MVYLIMLGWLDEGEIVVVQHGEWLDKLEVFGRRSVLEESGEEELVWSRMRRGYRSYHGEGER